jgi:hypothetical protein
MGANVPSVSGEFGGDLFGHTRQPNDRWNSPSVLLNQDLHNWNRSASLSEVNSLAFTG